MEYIRRCRDNESYSDTSSKYWTSSRSQSLDKTNQIDVVVVVVKVRSNESRDVYSIGLAVHNFRNLGSKLLLNECTIRDVFLVHLCASRDQILFRLWGWSPMMWIKFSSRYCDFHQKWIIYSQNGSTVQIHTFFWRERFWMEMLFVRLRSDWTSGCSLLSHFIIWGLLKLIMRASLKVL